MSDIAPRAKPSLLIEICEPVQSAMVALAISINESKPTPEQVVLIGPKARALYCAWDTAQEKILELVDKLNAV